MSRLEVFNTGKTWAVLDHHTMTGVGFTKQEAAERVASHGVEYVHEHFMDERRYYDKWLNQKLNFLEA